MGMMTWGWFGLKVYHLKTRLVTWEIHAVMAIYEYNVCISGYFYGIVKFYKWGYKYLELVFRAITVGVGVEWGFENPD